MNIAMLVAGEVAWEDGLDLGCTAVGGWSESEEAEACVERFVEAISQAAAPADGELHVHEDGGCVRVDGGEGAGVRVAFSSKVSSHDAAVALSGRLSKVRKWLYELRRASQAHDVAGVIQVAMALMGKSLILFDGAFNLVHAQIVEGERSEAMEETERRGYASEVSADHQALYRRLCEEKPRGVSIMYPEPGRQTPVWSQPIGVGTETFRLHVMNVREANVGMFALAHCVAGHLEHALEQQGFGAFQTPGTDFVTELLSREHADAEVASRARFFGWTEDGPWVAMRVEPVSQAFPAARLRQIAASVSALSKDAHASAPDTDGFNVIATERALGADLRSLVAACRLEGVAAGYGDPVERLSSIGTSFTQAVRACTVAKADPQTPVRAYDDCKLGLARASVAQAFTEMGLEPLALKAIRAHDAREGSEYLATIRVYLACGLVKSATCELLHIHRTTLDYRLRRLREEFGVDFDSAATRELFQLALLSAQ